MKWRSILMAAFLVLAVTFHPPHVVADPVDDATVERFDSEKFWSYAGCAASIALGVGTGAWLIAVIACGKAATTFWTT